MSYENQLVASRKWKRRNPQKIRHMRNRYDQRLRDIVLEMLGEKCVKCGFSDVRALQIDHINGGGHKESTERTRNKYIIIIESILAKENKYQLLCANCNWIKRVENNEIVYRKK